MLSFILKLVLTMPVTVSQTKERTLAKILTAPLKLVGARTKKLHNKMEKLEHLETFYSFPDLKSGQKVPIHQKTGEI